MAESRITESEIDALALEREVLTDRDGALVTFRGIVRDHDGGRPVSSLEYQAHPEAERFLREACDRIAEHTGVRLAAAHRTGHLRVGDVALVAVAASGHRAEAYLANERLVDLIKLTVPIWKRQHFADGPSEWVGL
jgi:molybdopterin synthase catalytic subunit